MLSTRVSPLGIDAAAHPNSLFSTNSLARFPCSGLQGERRSAYLAGHEKWTRVLSEKGSEMEICCGTTTAIHDSPPLSMSVQNTSHLCRASSRWIVLLVFLLLAVPALVRAQDAVRPSLAGEAASEARRQDVERIPYNLLVGPVRFRLGASIGVEYNDNINYAEDGFAEKDVIIHPQVTLDAIWPSTTSSAATHHGELKFGKKRWPNFTGSARRKA